MSRQLPVPIRPDRVERRAERPEVIVLDPRSSNSSAASSFGKMLVGLTPDLLRVVERSMAQRNEPRTVAPIQRQDPRAYRGGVEMSEIEYDTRLPFLRKVTVRKASAWTSDLPFIEPAPEPSSKGGGKLRTAGIVSVGGAVALAALGVLASRAGSLPGIGSRRGY